MTGNQNDPPYQLLASCPVLAGEGGDAACGPRLSADGSTLAYPARLSPVSPDLAITVGDGNALQGNLIDLVSEGEMSDGGAGFVTYTVAVTYTNTGPVPIELTAAPTATTPFQAGQFTCDPPIGSAVARPAVTGFDTLAPEQSCHGTVTFDGATTCPAASQTSTMLTGDLVTTATTSDGQTDSALVATCAPIQPETESYHDTPPVRTVSADTPANCAPQPEGLTPQQAPEATRDNQGTPMVNTGQAETGAPMLTWLPVSGHGQLTFLASDCSLRLVAAPPTPPIDQPPAC